jgi:hypothetical protein
MQWSCQVPKESYMAHPISDLRSTRQNAAACHSIRLWDCSVPSSGRDFGVRGHVRAFESGDMSPHSKASAASTAKPSRRGCVTRHNFMFFCLSCPLVRCSLAVRWIQNFCVGCRNLLSRSRADAKTAEATNATNYFLRVQCKMVVPVLPL